MSAQPAQSWLLDKSAYLRMAGSPDEALWTDRAERGLLKISPATILEIGYSARSARDWSDAVELPPLAIMPRVYLTPAIEDRAITLQAELALSGRHRGPATSDFLLAGAAKILGLVILHDNNHFELIAEVSGQPVERLRY